MEIGDAGELHWALCEQPAAAVDALEFTASLLATLQLAVEGDVTFYVPPSDIPRFEEESWPSGPDYVLIAWCDDCDGTTLYAVPTSECDDWGDISTHHGLCFGNFQDVPLEKCASLLRLLARLGCASAADFDEVCDFVGEEVRLTEAELEPLWNAWSPYAVLETEHLRRRFVALVSINKASG